MQGKAEKGKKEQSDWSLSLLSLSPLSSISLVNPFFQREAESSEQANMRAKSIKRDGQTETAPLTV